MQLISLKTVNHIYGGQSHSPVHAILDAEETLSIYFGSAVASNIILNLLGVSPLHSFPISLFSSLMPVYAYAQHKKNPAEAGF